MSIKLTTLPTIEPANLQIRIVWHENFQILSFSLLSEIAGYHHASCGEVKLTSSPREHMEAVYQELGNLATVNEKQKIYALRRLDSLGRTLWQNLIPQQLKDEYWQFKGCIKSVLITSDEPWVPWEMVKPYRYEDSRRQDDQFLSHVGVFIGAMWEVDDNLAYQFAQTFYTELLQSNQTIAEAFLKARESVRLLEPYNSTWLAYSLYAEPHCRFKQKDNYIDSTFYNYSSNKNLAGVAAQIQQLLKQLEQIHPCTTELEKLILAAKVADAIKHNPTLKAQIIDALKSEGKEAFKEAVNNPLVNVLVAILEGWQETQ